MNTTSICGIPVVVTEDEGSTVVTARWTNLTPIQAKLIKGWLEYKGNVVVAEDNAIKVTGSLTQGSLPLHGSK